MSLAKNSGSAPGPQEILCFPPTTIFPFPAHVFGTLPIQLGGGLEECCELPQPVRARSPADKQFLMHSESNITVSSTTIDSNLHKFKRRTSVPPLQIRYWYSANTQQLPRQNFCSRETSRMELSSGPATQSRHHLRMVQTTAEGTSFSGTMNTALCDF